MHLDIPRIVIAGVTSGVGKTTVTTGLIGALRARGMRVQPFKCGPDYIDPSHLGRAAGVPARNLDSWMLPHDAMRELFAHACRDADIAVIEGVMGLFDGKTGRDESGSTAEIAKLLDAPVVLVMDVAKVARSAAATALGFQQFDKKLQLSGLILNRIGSPRHGELVQEAIAAATGLPTLGALPLDDALLIPERHLGLVPDAERTGEEQQTQLLAAAIAQHCDLDGLRTLACQAVPLSAEATRLFPSAAPPTQARIAVAQDMAFSFYYQDNLDLLSAWGATVVPFSPIQDPALPIGCNGLYIGGGFPELYAAQLAANAPLRQEIANVAARGLPIIAECGGLMYLMESLTDFDGVAHPMLGLLPGNSVMQRGRVRLGYYTVKARRDNPLLQAGESVRGHEFHWSGLEAGPSDAQAAFDIDEHPGRLEGFATPSMLASYVHLHFGARPDLAPRFVTACQAWAKAG